MSISRQTHAGVCADLTTTATNCKYIPSESNELLKLNNIKTSECEKNVKISLIKKTKIKSNKYDGDDGHEPTKIGLN